MLIGKDFDKVEFQLFGFDLVEPNALFGDTIILLVSLFIAFKIKQFNKKTPFYNYWIAFFVVFGFGFFMGGLGHSFFNYWGVPGKYASWYIGIIAVTMIELAMLSIYPNEKQRTILSKIAIIKAFVFLLIQTYVLVNVDLSIDPQKGLLVPTLSSVIGLGIVLGFLSYRYQKIYNPSFRYLWISALVLIPTALVQALKINILPLFDRNDISHILLITTLILYYIALKKVKTTIA
ncbi:MAG: hypothetical protein V4638_00650 [Bacteroidota bacterium]